MNAPATPPTFGAIRRATDHPALGLVAGAWLVVGALAYTRHVVHRSAELGPVAAIIGGVAWLTCYVPWIPLTLVVSRLERRFPLGGPAWPRHLVVLAAAGLPMALVASALTYGLGAITQATLGQPATLPVTIWAPPELLGHSFLYWASLGGCRLLRALVEARDAERRAARLLVETSRLEASLRQAELDALRQRLQPHFLFNSLQNISVLIEHDPATGSRMLTRLGELLRASLRRDGAPETTLEQEIALTRAYLAVEQMRFGDRLSTAVELAPGSERALVPSFLLQPIVENALRHGLEPVGRPGVIVIRSRIAADTLVLSVTDNGAGPPADPPAAGRGFGIGLGATCERLARMYPGRHSFTMQAAPAGGTEVRLTLPLVVDRRAREAAGQEAGRGRAAGADRGR